MIVLMYSHAAAVVNATTAAAPAAPPIPPSHTTQLTRPHHVNPSAPLTDPYPGVAFAYALAIDDELLWGHNINAPHAPASLVKLLAALTLLDSDWDPNALISISERASRATRPRVGLRAGDKVRAEDALTAMLVQSANDACLALVEQAGPGLEAFASKMNARAGSLGMRNTRIGHPCGFDAEGQHSTVKDLMLLARAAHADSRLSNLVGRQTGTFRTAGGIRLSFNSTNQLLGRLDGVVGMKTGYTAEAGDCVVALAEQAGHLVWLVLLDSRQRWFAAHRILSDGLALAARRDAPPRD
jgi:D-alanyl-D-alanine carboxypeptidase (penicillin-binding protein 5/6)